MFNDRDPDNLDVIYVVGYNNLAKDHGPQAYVDWAAKHVPGFKRPEKDRKGKVVGNPLQIPERPPQKFLDRSGFAKKFGLVIADEAQEGLRNPSSFYYTIKWLDSDRVFLMTGYPMPRGLQDMASYMSLIEKQELAEAARKTDLAIDYRPRVTNPYEVGDDDPRAYFQASSFCFQEFVVSRENLSDVEKGAKAQKALRHVFIRRDYESALPHNSEDRHHTIAGTLPPVFQYTLQGPLRPTARLLYDQGADRWARRKRLQQDTADGQTRIVPNGRTMRALDLLTFFPPLKYLHIEHQDELPAVEAAEEGDPMEEQRVSNAISFGMAPSGKPSSPPPLLHHPAPSMSPIGVSAGTFLLHPHESFDALCTNCIQIPTPDAPANVHRDKDTPPRPSEPPSKHRAARNDDVEVKDAPSNPPDKDDGMSEDSDDSIETEAPLYDETYDPDFNPNSEDDTDEEDFLENEVNEEEEDVLGEPAAKKPKKKKKKKRIPQIDRDRDSWFYDKSELYKRMPRPDENGAMWRYLLQACREHGCEEFDADADFNTMSANRLLATVLSFAPKVQLIFSLIADYVLLGGEKIILWFQYPDVQNLVFELLHFANVPFLSMNADTSMKQRAVVQESFNQPDQTAQKVLLCGMRVAGVGMNLQESSRICVLVDSPDSMAQMLQVRGRQHRTGQTMLVKVFKLVVPGTNDMDVIQ